MGDGKHLAGPMCPDEHALEREHEAGQQHRRKQDELRHLDGLHSIARLRVERPPKNEVGSSAQIVFNDAIYSTDAVLPADFLPFLIGSPVIRDANLVYPQITALRDLSRDFRFESESGFLNLNRLDDFAAKRLVAGLHIGQIKIGEHVRKQSEKAVADPVPEIEHPMCLAAHES